MVIAGSWGGNDRLLPVRRSEFGPLDNLSEQAHELYSAGLTDQALECCRALLGPVERSGDRSTAWYLRYIQCLAYEQRCDWVNVGRTAMHLLGELGEGADPYWRAKALGMLSSTHLHVGDSVRALELLAEAYRLTTQHNGPAYNQASACHVLSAPLCAFLLFEQAMNLLDLALKSLSDRPAGTLLVVIEQARTSGTWGMMLELLEHEQDAEVQYANCLRFALRAARLAGGAGTEPRQRAVALALREFAYDRLTGAVRNPDLLRESALSWIGDEEPLVRLAHVSQLLRTGRCGQARALAERVRRETSQKDQTVPQWVVTAWLAHMAEEIQGVTAATEAWRSVTVDALSRLWRDRSVRFAYLLQHRRTHNLRVRVEQDDHRLLQDALTGVGNRRHLDAVLSSPAGSRTVAFVDVDHFKQVNDHFGHEIGDVVLRNLAALLQSLRGPRDLVFRYGGDEFVVVFGPGSVPGACGPGAGAWNYPERLRAAVAAVDWGGIVPGLVVEVSVGMAAEGPDVLRRADRALLAAKAHRDHAVPLTGR